jgi:hypothetical protein
MLMPRPAEGVSPCACVHVRQSPRAGALPRSRPPARQVFHACVPPCMLFLCAEFVWGVWIAPLAAPHVAAGGALSLPALLVAWPQWGAARVGVETVYVLLSVMSFVNILYFVMGFEKYGRFVLMLMQVSLFPTPLPPSFLYPCVCYSVPFFFCLYLSFRFPLFIPSSLCHVRIHPSPITRTPQTRTPPTSHPASYMLFAACQPIILDAPFRFVWTRTSWPPTSHR